MVTTVALLMAIYLSFVNCDVFDLTWEFVDKKTNVWPNNQPYTITNRIREKKEFWYSSNDYCVGEHSGTHLDAPYHFNEHGWKVADIPIDRLFPTGALVDLTNKTAKYGVNTTLEVVDLENWQKEYGEFQEETLLLVKFGWSKYWLDKNVYFGTDDKGGLHFPGICPEAAKWIADSGKFYGVGVDTASIDPGTSTDFPAHQTFAAKLMYNLENVKLTDDLPVKDFNVYALPMKLHEGTGAPVRVVATICTKNSTKTEEDIVE